MIVTFTHTDTITLDVAVRKVRWVAPFGREVGTATLVLPYDSPACTLNSAKTDGLYIREHGGSYLRIAHPTLGTWSGIITELDWGPDTVTVQAKHLTVLAHIRPIRPRVLDGVPAGVIADTVIRDGFSGAGRASLLIGTITIGGPLINGVSLTTQSVADTLNSLMALVGQEWYVDESGTISWTVPCDMHHPWYLVEGSDILDVAIPTSISEQATEVIAYYSQVSGNTGELMRATANEVLGNAVWPSTRVITLPGTDPRPVAYRQVQAALARYRSPVETMHCLLHRDYWAVRERDRIHFLLTRAGFRARCHHGRVWAREYDPDRDELRISMQIQQPQIADGYDNLALMGYVAPTIGRARVIAETNVVRSLVRGHASIGVGTPLSDS